MSEDAIVTVIVPTFNNRVEIELYLRSMGCCTSRPYRVIVQDNGSTDGTVEYLKQSGQVDLILQSTINDIDNVEGRAYDDAIRYHVSTPFFLVCHSDIIFLESDWVEEILSAAGSDEMNVLGGTLFSSSCTGKWILGPWLSPWYAWGRTDAFKRLALTWRRRFPEWCAEHRSEILTYFDRDLIAAHPGVPLFWEHGGFLTAQVDRHGCKIVDRPQRKTFHIGDLTGSVVKAANYPDEADAPRRLARSKAIKQVISDSLERTYASETGFLKACRNVVSFAMERDLPQLKAFRP